MNEKQRMYEMGKALATLKDAAHYTDTGSKDMPADETAEILFDVHIKILEALESLEEAMDCYLHQPAGEE